MSALKNILLIAYYFPPYSHSGVQRPLKFANHLPQFGYHPIVLTCGNMPWDAYDLDTYESEVNGRLEVFRTHAPRFDSLSFPLFSSRLIDKLVLRFESLVFEDRLDWTIGTFKEALKIVHKRKVQLIFTTGPPQSVHFLAYFIKKMTGIPWVMDFRDPMVRRIPALMRPKDNRFSEKVKNRLLFPVYERLWMRAADKIITVTEPLSEDYMLRYPAYAHKISTITNGYDEKDYMRVHHKRTHSSKLTLLYTGRFLDFLSPRDFIGGLRKALTYFPILRNNLEVIFIGQYQPDIVEVLSSPDLQDIVRYLGAKDHRTCLAHQLGSDINLLLLRPNDRVHLPGKFFEYLRAGKPIFGLVPEGITKKIIENHCLGLTVSPSNQKEIAAGIIALYEKWKSGRLKRLKPPDTLLKKYERRALTGILAAQFDQCLG